MTFDINTPSEELFHMFLQTTLQVNALGGGGGTRHSCCIEKVSALLGSSGKHAITSKHHCRYYIKYDLLFLCVYIQVCFRIISSKKLRNRCLSCDPLHDHLATTFGLHRFHTE